MQVRVPTRGHPPHARHAPTLVAVALVTPVATPTPTRTITVYLPKDVKDTVRVLCAQRDVKISDYVLGLIRRDLATDEPA